MSTFHLHCAINYNKPPNFIDSPIDSSIDSSNFDNSIYCQSAHAANHDTKDIAHSHDHHDHFYANSHSHDHFYANSHYNSNDNNNFNRFNYKYV
jgi:hypothetical protein